MAKYIVTGGAGFIGSHLVDRLVVGNEVIVIDNLSTGKKENINPKAIFFEKDICKSKDSKPLLDSVDAVFHIAANPDVRAGLIRPKKTFEENVASTYNLLEDMRKNDVPKIVFTSSSTVYGSAPIPTKEDYGPLFPESIYGASKLACEGLIYAYCHTFGFKSWIFRLANIVGERSNLGVIPDFIEKLRANPSELEILGDGKQSKSYLLIEECLDQILFAFEKSRDNINVFNIGSEDQISVKKIAELVSDMMGLSPEFKFTGEKTGWRGDVPTMLLSIEKLKRLGYLPKYTSFQSAKRATEVEISG